jgi:hypothetical protein
MSTKGIHIIALDVPFPPDYGGVIDIYFKAKALKESGIKVVLHCFEYGRGQAHDFTAIADEVYYYPRTKSLADNLLLTPFTIASRRNQQLKLRLLNDDFSILMEGHHCTHILSDKRFDNRIKLVRIHNIEWQYYKALAVATKSTKEKVFFNIESFKLKLYDRHLKKASALLCLSNDDVNFYKGINNNTHYLPVFSDNKIVTIENEIEKAALFQGNLSVSENEKAVFWIVEAWDKQKIDFPLIIAGKNPSKELVQYLSAFSFVKLITNPSNEEMDKLLKSSMINLLITFQSTGIKLKLLNALRKGNYCIANDFMVKGTGLESFCSIVNSDVALKNSIIEIVNKDQDIDVKSRLVFLNSNFNNDINIKKIIDLMK